MRHATEVLAPRSGSSFAIGLAATAVALAGCGGSEEPSCASPEIAAAAVTVDSPGARIVVMCADGTGERTLATSGAANLSPSWSPDRSLLAFRAQEGDGFDIFVAEITAAGAVASVTNLTQGGGAPAVTNQHPAWSPDGARIAFSSDRSGEGDIYVMNTDGGGIVRISDSTAPDLEPAWSPDGQMIVFSSIRDAGSTDLFIIDVTPAGGINERSLTDRDAIRDESPAWSPDGSRIAFARTVLGQAPRADIVLVNPDGAMVTQLTDDAGIHLDPAWSPDGAEILFTSDADGGEDLFIMSADGLERRSITSGDTRYSTPAWR